MEIADDVGGDAKLARIAGVSRSAVSQWRKNGVKHLKSSTVDNLQRAGYSSQWLLGNIGPKKLSGKLDPSRQADKPKRLSSEEEHHLILVLQSFLDADEYGRREIREAVEAAIGDGTRQRPRLKSVKRR